MNGVVDASLIPIWPEDQLEVHFGGQSAAQSSGAMGGSLSITQGHEPGAPGFSGFVQGAAGSFGRWESSAGLGYAGKKFSSKIRAAWQRADNDFEIRKQGLDGQFYTAVQPNNFQQKTDLQQFNQLIINAKNTLKSAFWYQTAFRELPPTISESVRKTWQQDQAKRILLSWEYGAKTRTSWLTKAAWLDDFINYHLEGASDTSRSRQILLSTERSSNLGKHWAWRTGAQALQQWAKVDGYADSTRWYQQARVGVFSMAEWQRNPFRLSALIRQDWAVAQAAPLTWSLGGTFELGRVGEARFHVSRNFNLPTLNDRYWDKFGKPGLRPEKGYSTDLSWALNRANYGLELSGFQLIMDDWILWQPDPMGIFKPDNLRKVWSRGLELRGKWAAQKGPWRFQTSGNAQVSKTTNIAVYGGSENLLGQQLPYTPKVSGGLNVQLRRKLLSLAYLQQFTGTRLDNSGAALSGFQVGNLLLSGQFLSQKLSIDFRIENLWGSRYALIRYRPMPGRSWRLGIVYRW